MLAPEDRADTPQCNAPEPKEPPPITSGSTVIPPEDLADLPLTRAEYAKYQALLTTRGWWNDYKENNFTVWDYLQLIFSMEFNTADFSPEILQETVVRNFYTQCGDYCDPTSELDVLRYIAVKRLTDPKGGGRITLPSDLSLTINEKTYTQVGYLNETDFVSAFQNPDEAWKSGCGNGDVSCDWGNVSLATEKQYWMGDLDIDAVKARFDYAAANSPSAPGFTTATNLFYQISGSGNSGFVITSNQKNCLYYGTGCP